MSSLAPSLTALNAPLRLPLSGVMHARRFVLGHRTLDPKMLSLLTAAVLSFQGAKEAWRSGVRWAGRACCGQKVSVATNFLSLRLVFSGTWSHTLAQLVGSTCAQIFSHRLTELYRPHLPHSSTYPSPILCSGVEPATPGPSRDDLAHLPCARPRPASNLPVLAPLRATTIPAIPQPLKPFLPSLSSSFLLPLPFSSVTVVTVVATAMLTLYERDAKTQSVFHLVQRLRMTEQQKTLRKVGSLPCFKRRKDLMWGNRGEKEGCMFFFRCREAGLGRKRSPLLPTVMWFN